MQIKFKSDLVEKADRYQETIKSKDWIKEGGNYTNLEKTTAFTDGRLAELIFERYLVENHIPYKYLGNDEGISDNGDFEIGGEIIDVKFVPPYGRYFLHNASEWERTTRKDIYIPVMADRTKLNGEILGYYTRVDVERMGVTLIANYKAPAKFALTSDSRKFQELHGRWAELGQLPFDKKP